MVTGVKTVKQRVDTSKAFLVQALGIPEVGRHIGISINIRPWWGSRRLLWERVHKKCGRTIIGDHLCPVCRYVPRDEIEFVRAAKPKWLCPGGSWRGNYCEIKWPRVYGDSLVLWEGQCKTGKRKGRHHAHAQQLHVLDFTDRAMLLLISVHQHHLRFLIGRDDGKPFVHAVTKNIFTVAAAYDFMVPKPVFEAQMHGFKVLRQGDWFFVPREFFSQYPLKEKPARPWPNEWVRERPPMWGHVNEHYSQAPLDGTRHVAELLRWQWPYSMVRGKIVCPDHPDVHLDGWHAAIRNIRTVAVNHDERGDGDAD